MTYLNEVLDYLCKQNDSEAKALYDKLTTHYGRHKLSNIQEVEDVMQALREEADAILSAKPSTERTSAMIDFNHKLKIVRVDIRRQKYNGLTEIERNAYDASLQDLTRELAKEVLGIDLTTL